MEQSDKTGLHRLNDSGETIDDASTDVRGLTVKDENGEAIGKVQDLLIDDAAKRVRILVVEHGGFLGIGKEKSFIPVDVITQITSAEVHIDHSGEHVANAPKYDPDLIDDLTYRSDIYSHYEHTPYWGQKTESIPPRWLRSRAARPPREG